ncbi:retropepsin-like aspartic protease [Flavobacterium ajazii]|uniref:retropepsin-like aspartic protease n=1 Tax=Flavobacterium ajazii TaxID=2692318 RepID=UPI0013D7C5A0|nr:retropepsin-like aspartic protease [Flavobacterium ajazii]
MTGKLLFAFLFFLSITTVSFGQKTDFRNGTILQKNFCDSIPFEIVKNKIIISLQLNGSEKHFLFDTGAVLVISEEIQNVMNYSKTGSVTVDDINGKSNDSKIVTVKELQIGKLTFQDIPSVVVDTKKNHLINCLNVDGILGSNLFRNCIVQIDLQKKIIILTDDIQKLALQNAYKAPITLNQIGKPYLKINLTSEINIEVLFDSGADKLISLSNKTLSKAIKNKSITILNEGFGVTSVGLHGMEEPEEKNRILIPQIKFGQAGINNVVSIVSERTKNALGIQLAEYGTITLDYINKAFYFLPLKQIQDYQNQGTFGFKDKIEENTYSIGIVWTKTQAEKIGLKNGFQILKINDLDFTTRTPENDCSIFFADFYKNPKINLTYKDDKGNIKNAELIQE